MNLKCMINGVEYDVSIPQGCVFSDEYNETLDSGVIILNNVEKIDNLLPYDDVFIYYDTLNNDLFYRHLLVDKFTYERINIAPYLNTETAYYTYKIELFSETKGLETVQLPNISITQPKNFGNKKTKPILYYLRQFVNMYSPKIKIKKIDGDNEWVYEQKYVLDQSDKFTEIFSNVYAPSFSLNSPNLRDVLSQLMLVKDMIPVVKDGVITGIDITKRNGKFNEQNITNITGSRTSENHCDALKRTYNNALSQENTCKNVEYIGFRNSDNSLMTLDNMRLETRFPIYKINKIYLCYYKRGILRKGTEEKKYIFLCKHDITDLVKLNAERQILKRDWNEFNTTPPKDIKEASEYRLLTVGYDIGSRYITGWGEKYKYIKNDITWWSYEKTYIQNLVEFLHEHNSLGIYNSKTIFTILGIDNSNGEYSFDVSGTFFDNYVNPFSTDTLGLKGLFFNIEYEGFYNGTVIHSKDDAYDNIVINDNSSSSLTLLEKDGLFQKEKVNRFGNEAIIITARYDSIKNVQPLGSVYEDDIIIYHREISIYTNFVLTTYYGIKDYVLKNYFTTVFSKHRPYNLLSYEESVRRSENKKIYLILSKNKLNYEKNTYLFYNDIKKILSFYKQNPIIETGEAYFSYPDKINYGYISVGSGDYEKKYASDINIFTCGKSLCFNMAMYDNVSGGVYIDVKEPEVSVDVKEDFTGSVQNWYLTVDNSETGFLENAGFYFTHIDKAKYYADKFYNSQEIYIKDTIYEKLFQLPLINNEIDIDNCIGSIYTINKDNKEIIDITYQIEPITSGNDVFFSPWMMKLSDLFSNYNKFNDKVAYTEAEQLSSGFQVYYSTLMSRLTYTGAMLGSQLVNYGPLIIMAIPKDTTEKLQQGQEISLNINYDYDLSKDDDASYIINGYWKPIPNEYTKTIFELSYRFNTIDEIIKSDDGDIRQIVLSGDSFIKYSFDGFDAEERKERSYSDKKVKFKKMENLSSVDGNPVLNFESTFGSGFDYFVNMKINNINITNARDPLGVLYFGNDDMKGFYAAPFKQNDDFRPVMKYYHVNPTPFATLPNTPDVIVEKSNYVTATCFTDGQLQARYHNKNLFVVFGIGEEGKIPKHLIDEEYENIMYTADDEQELYNNNNLRLTDLIAEEQITIVEPSNGKRYIEITIPEEYNNENFNPSSFQIWYYYEGSYKFVFGVNLSDEDKIKDKNNNAKIKIYISIISNRDPRVYKSRKGILDGYVKNYLEDTSQVNDKQYYEPIKKQ